MRLWNSTPEPMENTNQQAKWKTDTRDRPDQEEGVDVSNLASDPYAYKGDIMAGGGSCSRDAANFLARRIRG